MKHAMRKYLTVLLCAALLLGVFCPAAAAGKPTERAASGDLAGVASDPAKTIYATSEETTLVPAGYTYVYTGKMVRPIPRRRKVIFWSLPES